MGGARLDGSGQGRARAAALLSGAARECAWWRHARVHGTREVRDFDVTGWQVGRLRPAELEEIVHAKAQGRPGVPGGGVNDVRRIRVVGRTAIDEEPHTARQQQRRNEIRCVVGGSIDEVGWCWTRVPDSGGGPDRHDGRGPSRVHEEGQQLAARLVRTRDQTSPFGPVEGLGQLVRAENQAREPYDAMLAFLLEESSMDVECVLHFDMCLRMTQSVFAENARRE